MRIVFAGTPGTAVPGLRALAGAGHDVVAVVTRPDAPSGRGRRLRASPVADAAQELGIEVLKPSHPRDEDFVARLTALAPDVCAVVAYGALIPEHVLAVPAHGWVNLHFSLLPAWRGAAPVQRALMNGDTVTGVTTFRLVPALDAGPIHRQLRVPVGADETAGELLDRLAVLGADVLVGTMADIEAGLAPVDQDDEAATTAPRIEVAEARLDWTVPAARLARTVRGTSPHPGALAPGCIEADARHLWVGTGDGALELVHVQDFGRRAMSGADWARGAKPAPGARFDDGGREPA
ncbi:MAG: methionyl-tRNA formyltransferase [Propionibacterium acidifaciens]